MQAVAFVLGSLLREKTTPPTTATNRRNRSSYIDHERAQAKMLVQSKHARIHSRLSADKTVDSRQRTGLASQTPVVVARCRHAVSQRKLHILVCCCGAAPVTNTTTVCVCYATNNTATVQYTRMKLMNLYISTRVCITSSLLE